MYKRYSDLLKIREPNRPGRKKRSRQPRLKRRTDFSSSDEDAKNTSELSDVSEPEGLDEDEIEDKLAAEEVRECEHVEKEVTTLENKQSDESNSPPEAIITQGDVQASTGDKRQRSKSPDDQRRTSTESNGLSSDSVFSPPLDKRRRLSTDPSETSVAEMDLQRNIVMADAESNYFRTNGGMLLSSSDTKILLEVMSEAMEKLSQGQSNHSGEFKRRGANRNELEQYFEEYVRTQKESARTQKEAFEKSLSRSNRRAADAEEKLRAANQAYAEQQRAKAAECFKANKRAEQAEENLRGAEEKAKRRGRGDEHAEKVGHCATELQAEEKLRDAEDEIEQLTKKIQSAEMASLRAAELEKELAVATGRLVDQEKLQEELSSLRSSRESELDLTQVKMHSEEANRQIVEDHNAQLKVRDEAMATLVQAREDSCARERCKANDAEEKLQALQQVHDTTITQNAEEHARVRQTHIKLCNENDAAHDAICKKKDEAHAEACKQRDEDHANACYQYEVTIAANRKAIVEGETQLKTWQEKYQHFQVDYDQVRSNQESLASNLRKSSSTIGSLNQKISEQSQHINVLTQQANRHREELERCTRSGAEAHRIISSLQTRHMLDTNRLQTISAQCWALGPLISKLHSEFDNVPHKAQVVQLQKIFDEKEILIRTLKEAANEMVPGGNS